MSGRAAWTAMLDELERRAHRAEAAPAIEAPEPWHPHELDDALPPELAERAAGVLAAQGRAIAELRAQERQLRSQLHALGPATPPASHDVAVYLDAVG